MMTEIQSKILNLFKFVVSFLEQHDLNYIASSGTVIGAVRHNGFIPWDDDIDIYMWREDYNKLLSLKDELKKQNKDIVSIYTDDGYYLPFAKIIDLNTTLLEQTQMPFIMGNFIDIFPLDKFSLTDRKITSVQKKKKWLFHLYQATLVKEPVFKVFKYVSQKQYKDAFRVGAHLFYRNKKRMLNKFLTFERKYYSSSGNKCVSGYHSTGKIFKSDWFENVIKVPFEDMEITIPVDYDEYLSLLFGDWRTPPAPEKRISNHEQLHYYLNFKERLDIEEIENRLKNGENYVI